MDFEQPSFDFCKMPKIDSTAKIQPLPSRNPDISRDNSIDVVIMAEETSTSAEI